MSFSHSVIVGVAAGTAALLAGCGHESRIETRATVEVGPEVALVEIVAEVGGVTVRPGPAGAIHYRGMVRRDAPDAAGLAALEAVDAAFAVTRDGTRIRFELPSVPPSVDRRRHSIAVEVIFDVPTDRAVTVRSRRGHLAVDGWRAPVELDAGEGSLRVRRTRAAVRARTGAGDIVMDAVAGSVDASTGRGTVVAYLAAVGAGGVQLHTAEGGIQCWVPQSAAFELRMATDVGKLKDSFGVPVRRTSEFSAEAIGAVNGGGPVVELRCENGNASLSAWRPDEG